MRLQAKIEYNHPAGILQEQIANWLLNEVVFTKWFEGSIIDL